MADSNECPASSLKIFGQPLIIRNVQVVSNILDIDKVMVPEGFSDVVKLIRDNFPSIDVEQFCDGSNHTNDYKNNQDNNNYNISINDESSPAATTTIVDTCSLLRTNGQIIKKEGYNYNYDYKAKFEVPVNTFIHYSLERAALLIDAVIYPWDFLKLIQKVLCDNIKDTIISPNASIAKSSIIEGPCIIEDGVTIDDFCKIKGPTYIGKGSFIGMSSLIRNCMLGEKTRIGFNCEIARSYFAGHDKMAHQNVILDSVIGQGVWLGGYSGTANVLLNNQNIRYELNGQLVDTGTNHFGAVIGNNCSVGASVIILPGRQVPNNSIIQAGTIFGKKKVIP
jgi:UDP-N-acetylglucosamine diphosphorylase / glucose-1-phosphate thymidylyltransferase / UDP-N-acetylgalactosamine diphosphorylase / glucosamine-1-phosphate N-acetyltransferase / galactosamine-1-phosphate N-acetyltransferase